MRHPVSSGADGRGGACLAVRAVPHLCAALTIVASASIIFIMRALVTVDDREEQKISATHTDLAPLVAQVRLAIIAGVDQEFLGCEEVASLEVTAAQFSILKIVLKGNARSACELCKFMDYDRGAMSRMIDRLESKNLIRRVPLAHTRRTMALEVTAAGKAAFPKMEACLDRVVGRLLKGVTKTQVREAEKVLKRMLENV
jgi:DNA-binding MarR family transcriptional regulator